MATEETQRSAQALDRLGGGDFVSEGEQVKLTLTNDGVSWTNAKADKSVVLEWCDVIRCHRGPVSPKKPTEIQESADKEPCFSVHYIEKQKDNVWKHKYKTFISDENNFDSVLSTMCGKCKKEHPGRLLVVINPVGGSSKGKTQYERIVAPLFKLAQIETDVIVSKDPKHPEQIGETYDFSTVDGVVLCGGDGTYQQVIHTWLPRIQKDAGINIADATSDLKPPPCPIGMIPTGTGNGLALGSYGCKDIATAALNIISGRTMWKNLAGISSCGTHLGFAGVILANGTWSDMLEGEMEYRWLGLLRYPVSALMTFVRKRREFDIKLEYLPYIPHKDGHSLEPSTSLLEWESVEGCYTGVAGFPGLVTPNPDGNTLRFDHEGEGLTLLLEKQCGRVKYFSWLMNLQKMENGAFDADFITVKQVKAYTLKIVHKEGLTRTDRETSLENHCKRDGEPCELQNSSMNVRVHPKLIKMFGAGVQH